ncbi:MAG: hypothetical protein Q9209_005929 [Squamulea sp. 1 TL-2023]
MSSDDLSTAFQSLSIQSEPVASFKNTSSIQHEQQIPAPIPSPIPTPKKSTPIANPKTTESIGHVQSIRTPIPTPGPTPKKSTPIPTLSPGPSPPPRPPPAPKGKIPTFPRPSHPQCRRCGWIPKYRDTVKHNNPNGNAGRPYYRCVRCKTNSTPDVLKTSRDVSGWICWDDYIGIEEGNRACECGFACRQGKAGVDSYYPGGGFWTCAVGGCGFLSYRLDALTNEEADRKGAPRDDGFEPWLL